MEFMAENGLINTSESNKLKAGRPSLGVLIRRDTKWLKRHAQNALSADLILRHVIDESRVWQRVFSSEDDRVILSAMQFLVSMRDGKPAQRINVTSTQLHLNASELSKAREIIAEIRGDSLNSQSGNIPMSPLA